MFIYALQSTLIHFQYDLGPSLTRHCFHICFPHLSYPHCFPTLEHSYPSRICLSIVQAKQRHLWASMASMRMLVLPTLYILIPTSLGHRFAYRYIAWSICLGCIRKWDGTRICFIWCANNDDNSLVHGSILIWIWYRYAFKCKNEWA